MLVLDPVSFPWWLRGPKPAPVVGPLERLEVEVTLDDIAGGRRAKSMSCPVARALTRAYGPLLWSVWHGGVDNKREEEFRLDADSMARIQFYDLTGHMIPFTFTAVRREASE